MKKRFFLDGAAAFLLSAAAVLVTLAGCPGPLDGPEEKADRDADVSYENYIRLTITPPRRAAG